MNEVTTINRNNSNDDNNNTPLPKIQSKQQMNHPQKARKQPQSTVPSIDTFLCKNRATNGGNASKAMLIQLK